MSSKSFWELLVKSKLSPRTSSSLQAVEPLLWKGHKVSYLSSKEFANVAIENESELEDLMFYSTVLFLFGDDFEEPKPKNNDLGFRIYVKVAIVVDNTTIL